MRKDNRVYLKQMIDHIETVEGYIGGVSFGEFENNGMLQDAVMRKVELIGEAARRLSDDFWEKHRERLPLAQAVSTRNRLIHEYEDVDLRIVWNTVKKDLPKLKEELEEILG